VLLSGEMPRGEGPVFQRKGKGKREEQEEEHEDDDVHSGEDDGDATSGTPGFKVKKAKAKGISWLPLLFLLVRTRLDQSSRRLLFFWGASTQNCVAV
jgi:hypothetical protein